MQRVVEFLAAEAGIRQFLDIGTGIPTSPNIHEIAQKIAPESRIIYVDNDPFVAAHGRALLTSHLLGKVEIVEADIREPARLLNDPVLRNTFNFDRPVAVLMIAVLHYLEDEDQPRGIAQRLIDPFTSGSFLALSHVGSDLLPSDIAENANQINHDAGIPMTFRDKETITEFFKGLNLVDSVTPVQRWRPTTGADFSDDIPIGVYGGLAVKQ